MSTAGGAPQRWSQRVLLVGWDGADWEMIEPLIEQGGMPNLRQFIEQGMMGNIASLRPMISPILWTSIATGKTADKHEILGFAEPDPKGEGIRPVTSTSRKCRAVWNILSDAGFRCGVVNWFASHPAEPINGFVVTDRWPHAANKPHEPWPTVPRSVQPDALLEPASRMRLHPAMTQPAHVAEFLPSLGSWDAAQDRRTGELRATLARCASVHTVATWLMQEQPWDFCAIYYDAIDRFAHTFMEFHPPKMPHTDDEEFQRYQHVMAAAYRYHDLMLGRLMELAGDDTTIILLSDHGFQSGALRPSVSAAVDEQPVAWHRPYGILAAYGPAIKKDQRIYGASLLDVAPTILMLLGQPIARDMDGNPLRQVIDADVDDIAIDHVDTYETGPRSEQEEADEDPWSNEQVLRQLEALGYLERGASQDRDKIILDRERNLAQVHAAAGRPKEAIALFRHVLEKQPDDLGTKMACAMCHLQLRQIDECEQLAREVLSKPEDTPHAELILGVIEFHRSNYTKSLQHLNNATKANPNLPGVHRQLGHVFLRRRRWQRAAAAFQKALELDPHDAEAWDGLGVAYRQLGRPAEAVEQHMRSISLLHYRPRTHVHLGMALAESGQIDWAIRAFKVALEMNPRIAFAHHCLAQLYERGKKDDATAAEHRRRAASIQAQS